MLKRELGTLDLTPPGEPAELLVELEALREPGGAERMPLRKKPP